MRYVAVFFFALSISSPATAGMITVVNPGFEDLVLPGPGGAGNYALNNIPSWDVTGQTATFKPGAAAVSWRRAGGRQRRGSRQLDRWWCHFTNPRGYTRNQHDLHANGRCGPAIGFSALLPRDRADRWGCHARL